MTVELGIGIGPCITSQLRALFLISQCCRDLFPKIPIVAGGPLASIDGQEWVFFERLGVHYIVKGDGEEAIPEAINAVKELGDITHCKLISTPGHLHCNMIQDINSLQFPHRMFDGSDKFSVRRSAPDKKKMTAAMISSRGCSYNCRYCVSGNTNLGNVRKRTNANTISEMELLSMRHGVNDFAFYDDCFISNPKTAWKDVETFCNLLLHKNLGISWQMELRPDVLVALNDTSIYLLEKSGCRQINLGIEKITESGLQFLGKANSLAGLREQNNRIKDISRIKLSATFILGGGHESKSDVMHLIDESKTLSLDFAHFNPLFVYPGTPLYDDVFQDEKVWGEFILRDDMPWDEIAYENKDLKRSDLLELIDTAYSSFYENSRFSTQEMIRDRFNIKKERRCL